MSLKLPVLLVVCCLQQSYGSFIVMESSGNFTPLLTPKTSLKCSLNNSLITLSPAVVGKRDVTYTNNDVYIASILITKDNGEDIASITTHSKAHGYTNLEHMNTTGEINDLGQQKGFLEVVWSYPTKDQSGNYRCEITGISDTGHSVKFSESLSLDITPASMDALVAYIHEIKVENMELQEENHHIQNNDKDLQIQLGDVKKSMSNLLKEIQNLKNSNQDLQIQLGDLKNNMSKIPNANQNLNNNNEALQIKVGDLQKENQALKSQLTSLETQTFHRLDKIEHIEHGDSSCDMSSGSGYNNYITIDFNTPYQNTPIVQLSLWNHNLVFRHGDAKIPHYIIEADQVNKANFRVHCTLNSVAYSHGTLQFTWISLPSP